MTFQEMKDGYEQEVTYQKHMLKNLGYWFQLFTILGGIGIVLIYFYHAQSSWLKILGIVLLVLGAFGMLLFGYSGWKGQQNVNALIDDYESKVDYLHKKSHK
ncbi:PTS fructose transporter subunit IA [Companilactobacillus heilongjiangensis]|uniref:PTS fructose transporter subunit IA n=1 Tax=Companilactobacillus heilongjiangensis TaxID=1074467 RepID=A0A0K2LF35_9LACO|nr:PTS fructose transporter subunit IA [Companilactobacillus heilongjiangensis]ALB29798.1 PTS fructose transporter subunit IA [Companilactobacillus heilongjiangensis]